VVHPGVLLLTFSTSGCQPAGISGWFAGRLDFCTSPGPDRALADGIRPLGAGVTRVITDLGTLARQGPGEELQLVAVHPGVTADQVRAATGCDLRVAGTTATVVPTTGNVEQG
jgi:glutaconate CoA-transferase subunit B